MSPRPRISARLHRMVRSFRVAREHGKVLVNSLNIIKPHEHPIPLAVSMTSFPPRIRRSWFAVESLLQQSARPTRIILVLSDEEFPGRRLPRMFRRLKKRGLEILWVERNGKSFDKLLPVATLLSTTAILTVDDDKLFPRHYLKEMWARHREDPSAVIGWRGWEMKSYDGEIHYGKGWVRATSKTPPQRLLMPGGGGVLYPPGSLNPRAHSLEEALRVAPTADDLWFWGSVFSQGGGFRCLAKEPLTPVLGQDKTPALKNLNVVQNDPQFQQVLDYFEIRDKVLIATAS